MMNFNLSGMPQLNTIKFFDDCGHLESYIMQYSPFVLQRFRTVNLCDINCI
jgi:hypothetical protein